MSVIYGLDNIPANVEPCAVAVGVFDGVHWGHRAIFQQLIEVAGEKSLRSVALTFDRHPAELLAPNRAPYYINTLDQRTELILSVGVDEIVVAEFNHSLASLSPEDFIRQILLEKLNARHIVVGSNFRFGKARDGDVRYLMERAPAMGLAVTIVPSVVIKGGPVSSTRIRQLISRGDVSEAADLLGRRFILRGNVVSGRQVGRTLGFPTANIETAPRQLLPARGVYAVEAMIGKSTFHGVCNVGERPTFGGGLISIEAHLMGFEGDLYGTTLDVIFCRHLRDEMTFESAEHLAEQIKQDLQRASESCERA